jgi:hypothetical protein
MARQAQSLVLTLQNLGPVDVDDHMPSIQKNIPTTQMTCGLKLGRRRRSQVGDMQYGQNA